MKNGQKPIFKFQSLDFLNATIDEIYHRKKHYVLGKDLLNFKCAMVPHFVRIERVFRYVYFSDISLDVNRLDTELFKKQFPFICKNFAENEYVMHSVVGGEERDERVDGITYFFWFLEKCRNINLHSVISTPLYKTMKVDKGFIDKFPKISERVHYVKKGLLTVAGMLVMIFCVADGENLEGLFGYFLRNWGEAIWEDNGTESVKKGQAMLKSAIGGAVQANYEVKIRKSTVTGDILKDLFGRLYDDLEINDTGGGVRFGLDLSKMVKASRFGVCGTLTKIRRGYCLKIDRGSNIGKYFETDYELIIDDEKYFCERCNFLPPFMLVAFCYHNGIDKLDRMDKALRRKLNQMQYAKFYRDKDLNILCSDSEYADLKEMNKCVAESALKLFLDFEEHMIFSLGINVYGTYSKLSTVLKELEAPDELSDRLIAVRNFCAHYGLLNNWQCYNDNGRVLVNLEFIVGTLIDFISYLGTNGREREAYVLTGDLHKYISNNIIGVKYKRLFLNSARLFSEKDADKLKVLLKLISSLLSVMEKSVVSDNDESTFASLTEYNFTFVVSGGVLTAENSIHRFRELNLIIIEGEGLALNGCEITDNKLSFMETPITDLNAVTFANPNGRLKLVKAEKAGILNKCYYVISEEAE